MKEERENEEWKNIYLVPVQDNNNNYNIVT